MMLGPNQSVRFHLSQTPCSPSGTHRFGQSGAGQGWKLSYAGSLGCCADTQIHSWDCCGPLGRGEEEGFPASTAGPADSVLGQVGWCKPLHALGYSSVTLPWGASTPSSTHRHN